MRKLGIYIHIPFCKSKCYYCDFVSYQNKEDKIEEYIKYLKCEIKEVAEGYKKSEIKTIYIGGGTPSYLNANYIVEIMEEIKTQYNILENAEITIEVNPGTVTKEKLEQYICCGINRLSIGLQSKNNNRLKEIGRIHTFEDFLQTYNLARQAGFKNINIDLIIGLPNDNIEDIRIGINKIIELKPEHISVYSLIIEEGTKIEKLIQCKELTLPSDSTEREMYLEVKRKLEEQGYIHYEISNFAKLGYESKHNVDCWDQKEYIGFGVAAHSYTDNVRYSNTENLEEYINNYKLNKQEDNITIHERQDKTAKAKEYIILSLRKLKGINLREFEEKFNYNMEKGFKKEIEKLTNLELIENKNNHIRLTNKGLDFANIVWEEFL